MDSSEKCQQGLTQGTDSFVAFQMAPIRFSPWTRIKFMHGTNQVWEHLLYIICFCYFVYLSFTKSEKPPVNKYADQFFLFEKVILMPVHIASYIQKLLELTSTDICMEITFSPVKTTLFISFMFCFILEQQKPTSCSSPWLHCSLNPQFLTRTGCVINSALGTIHLILDAVSQCCTFWSPPQGLSGYS